MADNYPIKLSSSEYNIINPIVGNDLILEVPTRDTWVTEGYAITLYNQAGTTIATNSAQSGTTNLSIAGYDESNGKYDIILEDRSDLDNIQRKDGIAYVQFKKFPQAPKVTPTQVGSVIYEEANGNELLIPYYTTGYAP